MEIKIFLAIVDKLVPAELDICSVLDSYGPHKTATIQHWLLCRPRFHLHLTPTSASGLNW